MFSFFQDDLSYHKTATQSVTYAGAETLYGAGNAVDRNSLVTLLTRQCGGGWIWVVCTAFTALTLSLKITTVMVSVECSLCSNVVF